MSKYEVYLLSIGISLVTNSLWGYPENRWLMVGLSIIITSLSLVFGIISCDEDKIKKEEKE